MILCVDCDNVLNNLTEKTLELYNSQSGKNIQMSDIISYNFSECLPQEDADGIVSLFKEKELWDSLEPIKDSRWGIETLMNLGHRVIFATATHECNFEWKCQWLKKYFPIINTDDIVRIIDKSLIRADVIIDDCLEQLVGSCCERICFDMPWNQNKEKDFIYDIYRMYSWTDIINIINDIERKNEEWMMGNI